MKKFLQFDDFNSGFRRKAKLDLSCCKPKSQVMYAYIGFASLQF